MIFSPSTAGEVRHLNPVRHEVSASAFVSEIDRKIAQLTARTAFTAPKTG